MDEKHKRRSETESAAAKTAAKEVEAAEDSEPVPFERPVRRPTASNSLVLRNEVPDLSCTRPRKTTAQRALLPALDRKSVMIHAVCASGARTR